MAHGVQVSYCRAAHTTMGRRTGNKHVERFKFKSVVGSLANLWRKRRCGKHGSEEPTEMASVPYLWLSYESQNCLAERPLMLRDVLLAVTYFAVGLIQATHTRVITIDIKLDNAKISMTLVLSFPHRCQILHAADDSITAHVTCRVCLYKRKI